MFLIVLAVVEAATAPPQLNEKFTVTLPGAIGIDGKPEPVMFTCERPATPLSGAVQVFRWTCANDGDADNVIASATIANGNTDLLIERARFLRLTKIIPPSPVIIKIHVLGSGTVGGGVDPVVAKMTAKSPLLRVVPKEGVIVALKDELIVCVEPSFSVIVSGLKVPVRVASVGSGFAPPIGITPPLKEIPSAASVKYDEPKVVVVPLLKSTVKDRLDRLTVVETGHVGSGKAEEFSPVWLMISNVPVLAGMPTSQATYPIGILSENPATEKTNMERTSTTPHLTILVIEKPSC